MKAAYINQTGGPENIIFGDLPKPIPGPNQCLVRVAAVDVNPIDLAIRSGAVPIKLNFPHILGRDLAGTVVETGTGVNRFKAGDRVWATSQEWDGRQGTFSEFAAVDESWLNRIPDNVKDEEIAAMALVGITAHYGLTNKAGLQAGETLYVSGGTGGVGSSVVQMSKILGARVITTAGTEEKAARASELGADLVINYKTQDIVEAVKKFAPGGVNVWWETLSEPDFERSFPLMAAHGRLIVMAGRAAKPVFPVGHFYPKNCSMYGFALLNARAEELRAAAEDINLWMESGKLKAQIDRVLPLSETAQAHRLQEESTMKKSGVLTGKIVLKP